MPSRGRTPGCRLPVRWEKLGGHTWSPVKQKTSQTLCASRQVTGDRSVPSGGSSSSQGPSPGEEAPVGGLACHRRHEPCGRTQNRVVFSSSHMAGTGETGHFPQSQIGDRGGTGHFLQSQSRDRGGTGHFLQSQSGDWVGTTSQNKKEVQGRQFGAWTNAGVRGTG